MVIGKLAIDLAKQRRHRCTEAAQQLRRDAPGNAIAGTMVFMLGALVFILRRRVLVKGKKV